MAEHSVTLKNVSAYQDKQNGSLQRLEDRFNGFYTMLFLSLLGMAVNLVVTLTRGR